MARIKTSKGEAQLRPMLGKDEALIGRLLFLADDKDSVQEYFRTKTRMLDALDAATISADWEGGFGELPATETFMSLLAWSNATDDDAVPPASGTDSETK